MIEIRYRSENNDESMVTYSGLYDRRTEIPTHEKILAITLLLQDDPAADAIIAYLNKIDFNPLPVIGE